MSLDVYEKIQTPTTTEAQTVDEVIMLDHLTREKGRFKTQTVSGQEVRVFLERGSVLDAGHLLKSSCARVIRVEYAPEAVTRATAPDWPSFARACYHLGNRHVRLQMGDLWLQMMPDHVLEDMLLSFGLRIEHRDAAFIPERGAYSTQAHHHEH